MSDKQGWIRVEEWLPDNAWPCVVHNPLGYHLAWNTNQGEWVTDQGPHKFGKAPVIHGVTHWMPLPDPPEVEDEWMDKR